MGMEEGEGGGEGEGEGVGEGERGWLDPSLLWGGGGEGEREEGGGGAEKEEGGRGWGMSLRYFGEPIAFQAS